LEKILLKIGGLYHFLCAVLHVFFPHVFKWGERIASLSGDNFMIINANLNIMNYCLLVFWVMLAYLPFFHTSELLETKVGKALLAFVVIFWCIRIFVLQTVFVGYNSSDSIILGSIFFVGMLLFAVPLAKSVAASRK
jgi:hypothetical protein